MTRGRVTYKGGVTWTWLNYLYGEDMIFSLLAEMTGSLVWQSRLKKEHLEASLDECPLTGRGQSSWLVCKAFHI